MPLFDNNSEERGEVWGKSRGMTKSKQNGTELDK